MLNPAFWNRAGGHWSEGSKSWPAFLLFFNKDPIAVDLAGMIQMFDYFTGLTFQILSNLVVFAMRR